MNFTQVINIARREFISRVRNKWFILGTLMVPEMTRRGYKKSMSIGPILGTGASVKPVRWKDLA